MKFIADSPITLQLVRKWAHSSKVIIASHYFWLSGTEMQKSYQGLLQTLLFDIFRQSPYLIQEACANRWADRISADPWSLTELRHSFQIASKSTSNLKFCFFIDGMDEYSGGHEDQFQLCQIFKQLAKSGNIKLCLSSRPWNVFEEAFGDAFPKLYVQDLTRKDIETYVQCRLQEHPRWDAVSSKYSQGQWLVSEVTARSNGVFLWVYLVVKLLREGLTNRDEMFDLRRRLRSFPSELEPFFKTILESVQPFYHSHMSTALQLAISSDGYELSFLVFHFLAREHSDESYAINLPIKAFSDGEIREIKSNTKWHLDSRTRGLLEIHKGNVQFLHRSVRDFLRTKEMRELLLAKVDDGFEFHPTLSIVKALLAVIKTSFPPTYIFRKEFGKYEDLPIVSKNENKKYNENIPHFLGSILEHAARFESECNHNSRHHSIMDELDRSLTFLLSKNDCKFDPPALSRTKEAILREQLVNHGLVDYLHSKAEIEPTFLANIGSLPILRIISEDSDLGNPPKRATRTDALVHILKDQAVDLNGEGCFHDLNPWLDLLNGISDLRHRAQKDALRLVNFLLDKEILLLSLKAGADPNVSVSNTGLLPRRGERDSMTATEMFVELCHGFVDRSQSRQALYLEVLEEFLRSSNRGTLSDACDGFTTLMDNTREKGIDPWRLPFLSRVNNLLLSRATIGGPDVMEAKMRQDTMARQLFPPDLYTPAVATSTSSKRRRQRKNNSNNGRR